MGVPTIEPMLASPGGLAALDRNAVWHYEVKWDGYRCVAGLADGTLALRSRGGLDLAGSYPELAEVVRLVAGHDVLLDGEIVALRPDGTSSFEGLQNHGRTDTVAHLMVFDLLHLDGHPLLGLDYLTRRALLEELLDVDGTHVHVPSTFGADQETALAASEQLRLEGLIAKRADSVYTPGRRSKDWIKIKNVWTQEVVVVGWSPGEGRRGGTLGSLLLAVPTDDGTLAYAGHVGTGFTDLALDEAMRRLTPLETDVAPVAGVPRPDARGARWVRPELVGEVGYGEWTVTGRLRHPVWRGWRDDKRPAEVRREA